MSVPAFIDITEEDQVQLKSFQKITKRPLLEEPLNQWFYQVIVTCLLAKMLRDADRKRMIVSRIFIMSNMWKSPPSNGALWRFSGKLSYVVVASRL